MPQQDTPAKGSRGITPHLNVDSPDAPAFTAADATAFALKYAPFRFRQLAPIHVVGVTFVTEGQVNAHFGQDVLGRKVSEANRLLCVVEVHGRFQIPTPPSVKVPMVFDTVYEVFDGRTGNILSVFSPPSSQEKTQG